MKEINLFLQIQFLEWENEKILGNIVSFFKTNQQLFEFFIFISLIYAVSLTGNKIVFTPSQDTCRGKNLPR